MPADRILRQPIAVSLKTHTNVRVLAKELDTTMAQVVTRAVDMYAASLMNEEEAQTVDGVYQEAG
jgi:hypothetical protein